MLAELLTAGLVTTIAGGIQEKAQIRRAKQNADAYFQRTNAEREAVEQAHRERLNKILARYAREDQEREARKQQAAGEQEPEQEQRTASGTIHLENVTFSTSSSTADSDLFDEIFKDFEKNFE